MENKVKGTYGVRSSPESCRTSSVMHRYCCADSGYSAENER